MDHPDPDLVVAQLLQAALHRLGGALDVGLDDDVQVLDLAGLDLAEQVLQADLLNGGVGLGLCLLLPLLHQLPGQTLVGHGVEGVARAGDLAETRDLHRHRGAGVCEAAALVVHHGPDTAHGGAGDDDVPLVEGAVLDQQSGHGAPALVQPGLDDGALGRPVGVGLQLRHLSGEGHHLQQVVDAHAGLGGDGADDGLAAPLLGHQLVLGELLHDAVGVGGGFIHLVDGHDDGDLGGLGVVDGLHGLGHDAVLGGHHQDGDVRDHGAPGPHGGEGLVAGGVQEGDRLAVDLYLVGADVLGDAAGLAGGHMGVADIVQQGGLAVVHVAHDHHHGGPGHQVLGLVLGGVDELLLDGHHHLLLHLAAHLLGDDGGGVEVDELAEGGHDAVFHQALDHLGAGLLHPAGQLAHADLVGDLHRQRGLLGDLKLQAAQLLRLLLLALVGEGHLAALLVSAAPDLLLALLLGAAPAAAGAVAAVGQILELLVVFVQVDVGGLPGVHHLGLAGHGLSGLLGLLGLGCRLGLAGALGGLGAALSRLLLAAALLRLGLSLLGLAAALGLLGRGRALGLCRRGVGEDHLDAGDLVVLGQVLKDRVQFLLIQILAGLLGGVKILAQNVDDLPGLHPEILRQLIHLILVYDTQIWSPPKEIKVHAP